MNIEFLPEAREEFYDAPGFYEGREIGLGIRFRAEISEVCATIQAHLMEGAGRWIPPRELSRVSVLHRLFHSRQNGRGCGRSPRKPTPRILG